ncbi:hypothetical protein ACMYSQ_009165 [Aspergillus niger]
MSHKYRVLTGEVLSDPVRTQASFRWLMIRKSIANGQTGPAVYFCNATTPLLSLWVFGALKCFEGEDGNAGIGRGERAGAMEWVRNHAESMIASCLSVVHYTICIVCRAEYILSR